MHKYLKVKNSAVYLIECDSHGCIEEKKDGILNEKEILDWKRGLFSLRDKYQQDLIF